MLDLAELKGMGEESQQDSYVHLQTRLLVQEMLQAGREVCREHAGCVLGLRRKLSEELVATKYWQEGHLHEPAVAVRRHLRHCTGATASQTHRTHTNAVQHEASSEMSGHLRSLEAKLAGLLEEENQYADDRMRASQRRQSRRQSMMPTESTLALNTHENHRRRSSILGL